MYPAARLAGVAILGLWLVQGHSDAMEALGAPAEAVDAAPAAHAAEIAPEVEAAPEAEAVVVELTPAEHLAAALAAARAGDWEAATASGEAGGAIAGDIIHWLRLRDGAGDWREYHDFLATHPDWPNRDLLRRAAERRIPMSLPSREVFAFFGAQPEMEIHRADVPRVSRSPSLGEMMKPEVRQWHEEVIPVNLSSKQSAWSATTA
jgi:hypothetical protein